MYHFLAFACGAAFASAAVAQTAGVTLGGGGPLGGAQHCITRAERIRVAAQIERYEAEFGPLSQAPVLAGAPSRLKLLPIGGVEYGDLFDHNFVDLDPSAGLLDWNCTGVSYDGHTGRDIDLRSFAEQALGVPVFAAADGVVVAFDDGHPDMNTDCSNPDANYVVVDHGGGRTGWYWHLRRWSITVLVGQPVHAGQILGLVGSSGCSTAPHLHFEVRDDGIVTEPSAGPCRAGASGWERQSPMNSDLYVIDFAPTYYDLSELPGLPFELPRSGQLALNDPALYFWIQLANLPADSTWRVRLARPDGDIVHDSGAQSLNNQQAWRRAWFWWRYDLPELHAIVGTWRILVDFNALTVVDAPLAVRPQRTDDFNRPPGAVEIAFEPSPPRAGQPVRCVVETPRVHDDADYDLVTYEYTWTIDGVMVRQETTAGRADALQAGLMTAGGVLRCVVTPTDSRLLGPPTTREAVIGGAPLRGDLNCDGLTNNFDVDSFVLAISDSGGYSVAYPGCDRFQADVNGDGSVDNFDVDAFVALLSGG